MAAERSIEAVEMEKGVLASGHTLPRRRKRGIGIVETGHGHAAQDGLQDGERYPPQANENSIYRELKSRL
jgi:hypothetical protein